MIVTGGSLEGHVAVPPYKIYGGSIQVSHDSGVAVLLAGGGARGAQQRVRDHSVRRGGDSVAGVSYHVYVYLLGIY